MIEKKKNLLQEIGDVFSVAWSYITYVATAVCTWITNWKWSIIKKYIGWALIAVSSIVLFVDTVLTALAIADPVQLGEIVAVATGINIFSYVTPIQYMAILFGSYVLDMVFWTAVLWLGLYWANIYNLFTRKHHTWGLVSLAAAGAFLLMIGLYYAAPSLIDLKQLLHERHKAWHMEKRTDHDRNQVFGREVLYSAQEIFERDKQHMREFQKQFNNQFYRSW